MAEGVGWDGGQFKEWDLLNQPGGGMWLAVEDLQTVEQVEWEHDKVEESQRRRDGAAHDGVAGGLRRE